jgi:hypothetical protein
MSSFSNCHSTAVQDSIILHYKKKEERPNPDSGFVGLCEMRMLKKGQKYFKKKLLLDCPGLAYLECGPNFLAYNKHSSSKF